MTRSRQNSETEPLVSRSRQNSDLEATYRTIRTISRCSESDGSIGRPQSVVGEAKDEDGKKTLLRDLLSKVFSKQAFTLVSFLVLIMVFAAANRITYKLMLNRYRFKTHDYCYFLNQFTVILYCAMCFVWVMVKIWNGEITSDMRKFSTNRFAVMGFFDAFSGYLGTIGGVYTAGQLQTLLDQSVIPLTMMISLAFLHARYNRWQYLGAVMICAGVGLATVPTFRGGTELNPSGRAESRLISIIIYSLSSVPGAISNVYKEWAFKAQQLDIYYLSLWVSALQFLLGFLFAPLQAIPGVSGDEDVLPVSQIPMNLRNGFLCFLGQNSVEDDNCQQGNYSVVLSYVVINFVFNALLLLITKYGGALLLVLVGALVIPVTNIVFTWRAIMGDDTEAFSQWDVAGLNVVLAGFVVYSIFGDVDFGLGPKADDAALRKGEAQEEEESMKMVLPSIGHMIVLDINMFPLRRRDEIRAAEIRENYIRKLGIVPSPSTRSLSSLHSEP